MLKATILGRLEEKVEEVVNDEESLCMDEEQAQRRADFDRSESREAV